MNGLRTVVGIAGVTGVALALGLGLLLRDDDRSEPELRPATREEAPTNSNGRDLQSQLDFERTARRSLAEENDRLRTELAALKRAASIPRTALNPSDKSAASEDLSEKPYFDSTELSANGLRDDEIEEIQDHFARAELAELALIDEATRYGWRHKGRYGMELRELRNEVREEMSAEQYDWMLYAAGRDNRVDVNDMLPGSEAELAGFRRGDVIIRYDNKLVHDSWELTRKTQLAEVGHTIDIEILRGGSVIRLQVPSGQLGARFGSLRVLPGH
jgi:hypothetical protein